MSNSSQLESIFFAALEKPAPAERRAYLDEACAGDADLCRRIERMLAAQADVGSFLESPAADRAATTDHHPITERPGTVIGPYKLLQQIGEGGMGVVFMAAQSEPIQRTVALKIIKPGMDSRQVIARFEAERQALAMMDHPNIAKVLDAGTTDSGRPYFVMELVKGVTITKYCDEKHLPLRARLELFMQVCQAVQHAHQKGVIHRDIKPTNVLVAEYDNHAVPKVIDFGVAKATSQKLTDRTMFTEFGQVLGTVEYMSPEQAKLNQLDIDTRSDIYSLGVLLYELLTGSTPFGRQRLQSAAFDEALRIIREEEPQKPSTRLSTTDELPSIAANRHTEPARLSKDVRGELDLVVMKALEKERNRRYETASGFAADIQRYLEDEPVQACPPSAGYRFRKFSRRHKVAIVTISLVSAALLLGTFVSTWQAVRATRAEHEQTLLRQKADDARAQTEVQRKRAEGVNAFFTEEVFGLADPNRFKRAGITLLEALDVAASKIEQRFPDDPELRAFIHDRFGEIYYGIDQPRKAVEQSRRAVELRRALSGEKDPRTLKSRFILGDALFNAGRWNEARSILDSLVADQSEVLGPAHPDTLHSVSISVIVWMELDKTFPAARHDAALKLAQDAYDLALKTLGPRHRATLEVQSALAWVHRWRGEHAPALEHAKAAFIGLRQVSGNDDVRTMFAAYNYGACLFNLKRFDEAAAEFDALLKTRYRVLGHVHFDSLFTAGKLAESLRDAGKTPQALEVIDDVCARLPEIQATNDLHGAHALFFFADKAISLKSYDQAAKILAVVDAMYSGATAEEIRDPSYVKMLVGQADLLATSPQPQVRNGKRAIELATMACEASHYENPSAVAALARAYRNAGDDQAAAKHIEQAEQSYRKAIAVFETLPAKSLSEDIGNETNASSNSLAELLGASAQPEEAEQVRRQRLDRIAALAAKFPNNDDYALALAQFLCGAGDLDAALAQLTKTIARNANLPDAWSTRGDCYLKRSEFARAAEDFSAAIKLKPQESRYWHERGYAYQRLGDHKNSITDYSKSIELGDHDADQRLRRGSSYRALGDLQNAEDDFSRAIELNPGGWEGWHARARLYSQQHKAEKASSDLANAVKLATNPGDQNGLAWALAVDPDPTWRNPKLAVELAERAIAAQPDAGGYWNTLGAARYRNGQWKVAISALEKSVELRKDRDSYDWFFLAMSHWQLGEKDAARKWYDKAVEWMDKNQPNNNELRRFRTEAEEMMKKEKGVSDQKFEKTENPK